jgi:glycosyltransferase involved in cell wall biosynthesis
LAELDQELKWKAAIVGDGSQQVELEATSKKLGLMEKVHFFGYRENRLEFLKGFDCFVLPSRLEGIPRCLMEAMAAKVPVIASDIAGCRDLIQDGVSGMLFELESVQELKDCLSKAMSNPESIAEMAALARELIEQGYSADRMAREYEELYGLLMGVDEFIR